MWYNHILILSHTRVEFLRLKLGVISTAKQHTIKVQAMKAQNYITKVNLRDIFMQS